MIEQDHLQTFELKLNTRGPLFIGSGAKLPRKEYLVDFRRNRVAMMNEEKLFDLLIRHGLVEMFEQYCMGPGGNLYTFLYQQCGLKQSDVQEAISYEISSSDVLDASRSLKDIALFCRDSQGRAYVPGSSLKGALRTVLLYQAISRSGAGERESRRNIPEAEYLHTLGVHRDRDNAVNSVMRGLQVADSAPIDNRDFILVQKIDAGTRGGMQSLNLCRECVRPNTVITSRITLDQSILKGQITKESILEAISSFAAYYRTHYSAKFAKPDGAVPRNQRNLLYLGGGAGYFSKTLTYPYLGDRNGLETTSALLARSFRRHRHEEDVAVGISPHMEKYGCVNDQLYHFGVCEVSIQ